MALLKVLLDWIRKINMALHDVDKNNNDRTSPAVNAHDKAGDVRMAHGTTSVDPKTDATTTEGYLQTKNGRILGNDGLNNVGLFGFDDSGDMVVKVAKPGYDANSATDSQLIFNSSQNVFKIALSDTTTVTTPATMTAKQVVTSTIPHGLGQTPAFLAYVNVPNLGAAYVGANALQNVPFTLFTYNITPLLYVYGAVDSTNLTLNVANLYDTTLSGVGATWSFKYYILQETAN